MRTFITIIQWLEYILAIIVGIAYLILTVLMYLSVTTLGQFLGVCVGTGIVGYLLLFIFGFLIEMTNDWKENTKS